VAEKEKKVLPDLNHQAVPQGASVDAATGATPDRSTEGSRGESERESIKGKTEGPELDKPSESKGDERVDALSELVEKCLNDDMQIAIIAQKVGILNATFVEPIDQLDIIDLLGYARDKLDARRRAMSV
jgi:hypothetical protein